MCWEGIWGTAIIKIFNPHCLLPMFWSACYVYDPIVFAPNVFMPLDWKGDWPTANYFKNTPFKRFMYLLTIVLPTYQIVSQKLHVPKYFHCTLYIEEILVHRWKGHDFLIIFQQFLEIDSSHVPNSRYYSW